MEVAHKISSSERSQRLSLERMGVRVSGSGSGPAASPQPINSVQAAAPASGPLRSSHPTLCFPGLDDSADSGSQGFKAGGGGGDVTTFPDSGTWRVIVKDKATVCRLCCP